MRGDAGTDNGEIKGDREGPGGFGMWLARD